MVNGQADVCKRLLEIKFDHIFFTGSKRVGKIIYQKAAEQFTTCTLELGGKSPVYVDKHLSVQAMERACARLIWGKMLNSGKLQIGCCKEIICVADLWEFEFPNNFKL